MPWAEQIEAVWWGLGIGTAIVIAIWAVIAGAWSRRTGALAETETGDRVPEGVAPVHEYAEGIAEAHGPVPLILQIIIVSVVLWTVGYIAVFVTRGFTF
jgi:hypothetical protein